MKSETAFNLGVLCGRLCRIANTIQSFEEKRDELIQVVNEIDKLMEKEDEEDGGND